MTSPSSTQAPRPAEGVAASRSALVWWEWDLQMNTVVATGSSAGTLGFPPCELPVAGKGWEAYTHPDDLPRLRESLQAFFDGSTDDWRCELRLLESGGGWHWVLNTGKAIERNAAGQPTRMLGVTLDVMANHVQQDVILRNAQMLANVRQSMVCTDLNGIVTFWSEGARELYGWTAAEMLGRPFYERMPTEEMRARARVRMTTAAAKGEYREEREDFRKDGSRIYVDSRVFALRNAAGDVVGVIGTAHDITARRQAEHNRLQLERQLLHVQRMDTIGTLSGGIAHEFNNILAAIMGNIELCILMDPKPKEREHLEWALQSTRQGRDLVKRILSFGSSRLSERSPVDLGKLLAEAAPLIRATLPTSVELVFEAAPGCPAASMDSNQVHEILMNLAANASYAMQEKGGRMTFRVRSVEFAESHGCVLGTIAPGRYLALEVADTGEGIQGAHLGRIFDPFFSTKPVGEGRGLGLAIVNRIVADHEGGIDVASVPGSWTRFTLYFPSAPQEAVARAPAAPPTLARGRGEQVVVIDDEANVAKVVETAFKRMGYQVRRFCGADEFYAEFHSKPFHVDLVFTDQTMPRMTGLCLSHRLRAEGHTFPIAIASGHSPDLTEEALAKIKPYIRLEKPFDIHSLSEAVHRLLGT